ncbi:MAG: DUF5667 domain-containing protein [Candidatus Daviesbacteria bacterium]|nr:DUF5667 domain-containing protein [Candidatus Daviesbacteria bacterium]
MKYKVQLGLIILLAISILSLLLSMGASPDMPPFFALKRVQENIFLQLKSNPTEKLDYMSSLLNSRLEELQNVVKNKNYDYVLKASLRYSTLAGRITEAVTENNLTDKVEAIKNQFLEHQKILDKLYVAYPKNIPDNVEWKYIQDDFNYLKLYLDKLEKVK